MLGILSITEFEVTEEKSRGYVQTVSESYFHMQAGSSPLTSGNSHKKGHSSHFSGFAYLPATCH